MSGDLRKQVRSAIQGLVKLVAAATLYLATATPGPAAEFARQRYAVVIGNSAYEAGNLNGAAMGLQLLLEDQAMAGEAGERRRTLWVLVTAVVAALAALYEIRPGEYSGLDELELDAGGLV